MPKKAARSEPKISRREVGALKDQLTRALADYDNLRKRFELEKEFSIKFASERIITRLLPIYDMLIEAQKHLKDSGLAITIGELENLLMEEGLEKINAAKGVKFDENLHDAVEVSEGPRKGVVMEELLTGWKFVDGPVVRYSKVKVTK